MPPFNGKENRLKTNKIMNTKTIKMNFLVRAAIMLFLAVMTTATAWAGSIPNSVLDYCEGGVGNIFIGGWTYDPDAPSVSNDVHVYIYTDESCSTLYMQGLNLGSANLSRPDVNAAWKVTGNHGFKAVIPIADAGTYYVRVYAIDATNDPNPLMNNPYTKVTVTQKEGSGTAEDPYIISNVDDWSVFASFMGNVNVGYYYSSCSYRLLADIGTAGVPVQTMMGSDSNPFSGHFDGNDKTIHVAINQVEDCTAPFHQVNGATIEDLTVTGSVTSSKFHTAGLVGGCNGNIVIRNCCIKADVHNESYSGGIIGHGGTNNTVLLENCVYSGTISGFKNFTGGLLGWCNDITLNMKNCLFKGTFMPGEGGNYHPIACRFQTGTVTATVTDTYYLYHTAPSVGVGANAITGAEGTPVSSVFTESVWEKEVKAADGLTYYTFTGTGKSLPYSYGFENGMSGWTVVNAANGTGIQSAIRIEKDYSFMFVKDNQNDQILISPEFYSSSTVVMTFSYYGSGVENAKYQFGFSKTTNSPDAFEWGEQTYDEIVNGWMNTEVHFPAGSKYIAIKSLAGGTWFYIDDIKLSEPYPSPVNLVLAELTDVSATLTWVASGIPVSKYRYTLSGNNTIRTGTTTETSITFADLKPNTEYKFSVNAVYEGEGEDGTYTDTSSSLTCEFTTKQKKTALPYTQDFEKDMGDWQLYGCISGTDIWSGIGREDSKCFYFNQSDKDQYIVSPLFVSNSAIKVSFYYRNTNSGNAAFKVGYSIGSGEPVQFAPIVSATTGEWQEYVFYCPKETEQVVIYWLNTGGALLIDDFKAEATMVSFPWMGSGTEKDPYMVNSTTDLNQLASNVSEGVNFSGIYFKLGKDIIYSHKTDWSDATSNENNYTAIGCIDGNTDHPFLGYFDGDGHAVSGIRIFATGGYQGLFGLIGSGAEVKNVIITNVRVTGGSACGAVVGRNDGGTLSHNYYLNCSVGSAGNGINVGTGAGDITENNGAVSVHKLILSEGVTATPVTMTYDGVNYYAQGTTITLGHSGYVFVTYTLNGETLSGNTFTMPAADATITAAETPVIWAGTGTKDAPFIIKSTTDLDQLAIDVNAGKSYSGKYFKLGADITYSHTTEWNDVTSTEKNYTSIGRYDYTDNKEKSFCGHFDGDGHTVSGIRIYEDNGDNYPGLFGMLGSGAEVKNVTVTDTRIYGDNRCGGIAGYSNGNITNCHVSATVALHARSSLSYFFGGIAGFVGEGIIISNCSSAVTITAVINPKQNYKRQFGAIAGFVGKNTVLSHNFAIKANVVQTYNRTHGVIVGDYKGTLDHNYYIYCTVAGTANATNVGTNRGDITENNGAVRVVRFNEAPAEGIDYFTYDGKYYIPAYTVLEGDANSDHQLDANDISEMVNAMAGHPSDNFILENADFDGDGIITIAEVIRYVNEILSK
jgi:hypothetical protein